MPLRSLLYIARVYEKIIDSKNIYKEELLKIPKPEFFVLYNGKDEMPDESVLKLSDAFIEVPQLKELKLELEVKVLNINLSHNPKIIGQSNTLSGYTIFIGKVKEYSVFMAMEEAVKAAIKYCIDNNILKEFLKKHS
jgi:hypothetical protein